MAVLIEDALRELGAGRAAEAERRCRRHIEGGSGAADGWLTLAFIQQRRGRGRDAEESLANVVRLEPGATEAWLLLAGLMRESGRPQEALRVVERAAASLPDAYEIQVNLLSLAIDCARDDVAGAALRRLEARWPERRETRLLGAAWCRWRGDLDGAVARLRALCADSPGDVEARNQLGQAHLLAGRGAEAAAHFRELIALDPAEPELYGNLAASAARGADPAPIRRLLRHAAEGGRVPREAAVAARYGLASLLDRLGEYPDALAQAAAANALLRERCPYDAGAVEREGREIREAFTRDAVAALRDGSRRGEGVVLIVGMPRSGTTLVEQILGMHPRVQCFGELTVLDRVAKRLASGDWSGAVSRLRDPATRRAAAHEYLQAFGGAPAKGRRVTDKLPANFRHLGLLAAIAPRARVVHVRRDPRDVAVSLFFQHFDEGLHYALGWDSIAHYHREYRRHMAHWADAFGGPILHLDYETLVGEQEAETRRLLGFLDLPFEEACMRPERAGRVARTASVLQVRERVSGRSVARWRRYASLLPPEIRALAGAGGPGPGGDTAG